MIPKFHKIINLIICVKKNKIVGNILENKKLVHENAFKESNNNMFYHINFLNANVKYLII